MIYYKTSKQDDPYFELWSRKEWLYPLENADAMQFPLIVTVEPTNRCQNKCLYCSRQLMTRTFGNLDLATMEKIAEESGHHRAAIRHGGFGEPLLHPDIEKIVAISNKYNVLTTIFTNGMNLSEKMMESFVRNDLSEIRFSSSGITPDVHNKIRRNSDYSRDFDEKIKMAHRVRARMGSKKPFFTLYTNVIDYNDSNFQENLEIYRDRYLEYVDKVDIDLTMFSRVKHLDHVKDLYSKQTVNEEYKKCVGLFLKVIVHWNGDLFACDKLYDFHEDYYLGNLKDVSIAQGYGSEKMKYLRDNVSFAMNHQDFEYCRNCYTNTSKWDKPEEFIGKTK
ncbi:MAG: radical SAM protein [Candidatus Omnitrophica bacterium]|nr:radical SAM protein [Candidatus Omnitrophota bacterium]